MIGARLGPYLIVDRLGSGGMGTVYLATRHGEQVAVKVFHPHLLEQPGFFKRFQREAEVGRLVRHPNVVRTIDCDLLVVDGRPCHFLVMEYVEGTTLRESLDDLGPLPEGLLREIGRQVVAGLGAIHDRGIVHRDLKPENVLITKDDEVKIMDLGVALIRGEAMRLSVSGQFVGSLLYAAPEQFGVHNRDIDARADLYALGLLLYEMASGDLPCYDGDVVRVIEMKTSGAPRRLGEVRPQVSPFLEEVVQVLLARDRENRFGSASELLEILMREESSEWWRQQIGDRRRVEPTPTARRIEIARETALHGRSEELGLMRTSFEDAASGQGRVLLLEGEAGVGKTRLVDETVARLREEGHAFHFLYGSYPPGGAATASGALCTAFRDQIGAEYLDDVLRGYLADSPGLVPAFAALLRGEPVPPGQTPLDKEATQTAFVRTTRALAAEKTTIVAIDDLHLAPDEGLAMFAAVAWAVPGQRILLIGTTRPGLPESWVAGLTRLDHVAHRYVPRLGADAVERILAERLQAEDLAQGLAPRVAKWSDGNPYFIFEILRGLEGSGLLVRRTPRVWTVSGNLTQFGIPASVHDLIQERISALDEDERSLLDVAACAGFEFDPVLTGEAVGLGAIAVLRRLGRLERTHRLVRAAGEGFVFDHHLVREALYEKLPAALRQGYHAAIAETLERRMGAEERDPDELPADGAVTLCGHFFQGGRGRSAVRYLDASLDHLVRNGLSAAALDLAERALDEPGLLEGAARASVLTRAAELLDVVGRLEDGLRAAEEAVRLADAGDDALLRLRALRTLGAFTRTMNRLEEAREHVARAYELARELGATGEEAATIVQLGNLAADAGCCAEAREHYERAFDLARDVGNRREVARAIGSLGTMCAVAGEHEQAVENARRCAEIFREIEDPLGEVRALGLLGVALHGQQRYDEAEDVLRRQLGLARETGYRRGEARATDNLGRIRHERGEFEGAVRSFESALDISREIGDLVGEGLASCHLGTTLAPLGRDDEARSHLERAVELHREVGDRSAESYDLHQLALLAEAEGDLEAAESLIRESLEIRVAVDAEAGAPFLNVVLARILLARDREKEARAILEEARGSEELGAAVLASIYLMRLGDPLDGAVFAPLEDDPEWLSTLDRAEAHFVFWKSGGTRDHLERARSLLLEIRGRLSDDVARIRFDGVPLHREILAG